MTDPIFEAAARSDRAAAYAYADHLEEQGYTERSNWWRCYAENFDSDWEVYAHLIPESRRRAITEALWRANGARGRYTLSLDDVVRCAVQAFRTRPNAWASVTAKAPRHEWYTHCFCFRWCDSVEVEVTCLLAAL